MALTLREYLTADGKSPFREWLGSLTKAVRARIQARVLRLDGETIIVLLVCGDKGSQAKDIARAQGFWRDFLEAKRHGKTK